MPRNGSGVYSKPSGTTAVSGTTISSEAFNTLIDDIAQDANTLRPITAGGTGAATVEGALANFGIADSISVGDLRTDTTLNTLFVSTSGRIDDGGLDYGITIKSLQPGLVFVDQSSGAGQSLINGNGAGLVFLHDAVSNDGSIGGPSNTDTNTSLTLNGTQQRFFSDGVETATFDSDGLTVGDVLISSTGVSVGDVAISSTGVSVGGEDITGPTSVLLETLLSGLGNIWFTGFDSALYSHYDFEFEGLTVAAAATMFINLSSDAGISELVNGSYEHSKITASTGATSWTFDAGVNDNWAGDFELPGGTGTTSGKLTLYNAGEAKPTSIMGKVITASGTGATVTDIHGVAIGATIVDGINFNASSPGTTFTSGSLRVIGHKRITA